MKSLRILQFKKQLQSFDRYDHCKCKYVISYNNMLFMWAPFFLNYCLLRKIVSTFYFSSMVTKLRNYYLSFYFSFLPFSSYFERYKYFKIKNDNDKFQFVQLINYFCKLSPIGVLAISFSQEFFYLETLVCYITYSYNYISIKII